ncbi:MAG: hypothetical protein US82_C0013G0035 [Parcubacteria group bacterium GW2011_GWC1_38_22]|nr:MAG: hypothetical protein US82_C0013G0035 [Parcubacteria group bacterium GW2011_GWC1_38_22]
MERHTVLGKIMEKILGLPSDVLALLLDLIEKLAGEKKVMWFRELKKFLRKEVCWGQVAQGKMPIFPPTMKEWQDFYKKHFGMDCDFSQVRIPEKPEGNWRLLIIADVLLEQLYAKCKQLFPCWRWTDENLDKKVSWNQRDAKNGAYAIWVRDVQESDEELRNISANDIKTKGITTETFAERLIHELKFFEETGKHLDESNVTLCAGSRCNDGDVPSVTWSGDKLGVGWQNADNHHGYLRSRETVS